MERRETVEEFLHYVIRQLVEFPDEVVISRLDSPKKITFMVRMRQSDVGRVIGKHGSTIAAIRELLSAGASRHGQKAALQVIDESEGRPAPRAEGSAREV